MRKISSKLKGVGGIYKIENLVNGKVYIGRTKCFYKRCYQYLYDIRNMRVDHVNIYLLNSILKYGLDNFQFNILEISELENLSDLETYWINTFNSLDRNFGYNLRSDTIGNGMNTHPSTSAKISERLKLEWSTGVRKDHSSKLKKSWSNRDRTSQSKLMSKSMTKYYYIVDDDTTVLNYEQLVNLGLKSSFSSFSRKKSDEIICKGYRVRRYLIEN
jgi:group I intron endonuclease